MASTSALEAVKEDADDMIQDTSEVPKPKAKIQPASMCKLFSMMDAAEVSVLLIGCVGAIGNGLSQPLMCIVFGDLIDGMGEGTGGAESIDAEQMQAAMGAMMAKMEELCITMMLVGAAATLAAGLQGCCFKVFAEKQAFKLRVLYFDSVLHQDVSWYDTMEVAALPAEINDDLEKIQDALGDKFGNGVMSIAAFIGGFGCAFGMGWLIALVMCSTLPFMGVGAAIMGQAVQEIQNESQSWYAKASAVVEECLHAMRTVVAFGGEHREIKKFAAAVVETRRGGVKNGFKVGAGLGYTMMVMYLGYGLASWFGMTLRYNDEINPATGKPWEPGLILAIFFCIFVGSFMIGNLDPSLKAMKAAQSAAGRFFSVVEHMPTIQCRTEDQRWDVTGIEKFEFQAVHFTYPARPDVKVLSGLSLSIQRGQKVAVVGESGSGKSTVMALLERFYDPDSGAVLVNGQDMRSFKVSALRKCIGYVGQEPVLFASSIRHNIMQGNPSASRDDFVRACADAQLGFVDALPERYDTFVGSGGSQLSGGQKQRIAIARALLKKASFLFLDEATSALDNTSEKMIQDTIDSISANTPEGLGIVNIAHRLSTVRNSDLIHVLSRGKLVEQGSHAFLMEKKGTYYALVAAQESCHEESEDVSPAPQDLQAQVRRGSSHSEECEIQRVKREKEAEAEREKEIVKGYKVPMGRLLSYNRPEWPFFVPAILGAMVDGAANPVCTVALVGSMKAFFKPDKEEMRADLEMMALTFVLVGVAALLGSTLSHGCFSILGEAMTQRLRVAILTGMFRQEVGFHDDPSNTPGMLSKALELWAFRVAVLCKSIQAKAAAMSSLVVGLVIAFVYCWQMSLVMLASIPIMIAASALQWLVLLGASKNENQNITNANQIVVDSVMNARTVQALCVEKNLVHMYVGWVEKSLVGMWRRSLLAGIGFGVSNGIFFFIMAGGFYVASLLIKESIADFEGVMMAFMGIFYAGMGAGQAAVMVGDATKAKVACHDLFQLMDRVSAIDGLEPAATAATPQKLEAGRLEFRDVKFFYPFRPGVLVLKGTSFSISPGQSVGLVGPSGGGKSTVMSLIQRFYDPQEGQILIGADHVPLSAVNIRWWRRQIGFVGQEPILFNTTVRANIMYGLAEGESVSDEYVSQCEKISNLAFLYKNGNNGLETEVGPRGSRLSGGQKQRVAICRALMRNPPVLLLDEATSALDTQSEALVQQALEAAREGRTSFAIAHRLSTIQGCDVILVNADGRVVERGSHEELMALKGVYYNLQMQAQR